MEVRCIDVKGSEYLTKGQSYDALKVDNGYYMISFPDGPMYFCAWRFEPVVAEPPKATTYDKTPEFLKTRDSLIDELNRTGIHELFSPKRPAHYEAMTLDPLTIAAMYELTPCLTHAVKYLLRAGHKGERLEDLQKCIRCLQMEIEHMNRKDRIIFGESPSEVWKDKL